MAFASFFSDDVLICHAETARVNHLRTGALEKEKLCDEVVDLHVPLVIDEGCCNKHMFGERVYPSSLLGTDE